MTSGFSLHLPVWPLETTLNAFDFQFGLTACLKNLDSPILSSSKISSWNWLGKLTEEVDFLILCTCQVQSCISSCFTIATRKDFVSDSKCWMASRFLLACSSWCLMNLSKISPINLLQESERLHRLSAILSLWPCWEWWLDLSQPAIDWLVFDQYDRVALHYAHVFLALCVVWAFTLYVCCSLWTTAHLFHSISSLSHLNCLSLCQCCCAHSLARYREGWFSREQVFLM